MENFQNLDKDARCFALVGQFLQAWAVMEHNLHDCIRLAFKLTPTMTHIICANLRLFDKLNILRTLVDVSAMYPSEEKTRYRKLLRSIGEYSPHRNMIAHDPFLADEEGTGVEFLPVKAKGRFELPIVLWTAEQFVEQGKILDEFRGDLKQLGECLAKSPIVDDDYKKALIEAMENWKPEQPSVNSAPLGLLSGLFQLPSTPPDSDQAPLEAEGRRD